MARSTYLLLPIRLLQISAYFLFLSLSRQEETGRFKLLQDSDTYMDKPLGRHACEVVMVTHMIASAPSLSLDTNVLGMSNRDTLSVSVK